LAPEEKEEEKEVTYSGFIMFVLYLFTAVS
jgi:hypothetical protein